MPVRRLGALVAYCEFLDFVAAMRDAITRSRRTIGLRSASADAASTSAFDTTNLVPL